MMEMLVALAATRLRLAGQLKVVELEVAAIFFSGSRLHQAAKVRATAVVLPVA